MSLALSLSLAIGTAAAASPYLPKPAPEPKPTACDAAIVEANDHDLPADKLNALGMRCYEEKRYAYALRSISAGAAPRAGCTCTP